MEPSCVTVGEYDGLVGVDSSGRVCLEETLEGGRIVSSCLVRVGVSGE